MPLILLIVAVVVFVVVDWNPPNTYYPYLATDRAQAFVQLRAYELECVRPAQPALPIVPRSGSPLRGNMPGSTPSNQLDQIAGSLNSLKDFTVGSCYQEPDSARRTPSIDITLVGDDGTHVYSMTVTIEGALGRAWLHRLARMTAAALADGRSPAGFVKWVTNARAGTKPYSTRRFTASVWADVEAPSGRRRIFTVQARDAEPLSRALAPPGDAFADIDGATLARAFAPTFSFAQDDYRPLPISDLQRVAQICERSKRGVDKKSCGDFERLPTRTPCGTTTQTSCPTVWVLVPKDVPPKRRADLERELRDAGSRPTVYWNVVPVGRHRRIVQYWIYYLYNDWENKHDGDWESVQLDLVGWKGLLTGDTLLSPLRWFYSAHERGTVRTCASKDECIHPKVYVAKGSHANYFSEGPHDVEVICDQDGHCVVSKFKDDDAPGDEGLGPNDYDLVELADDAFPGRFGVKNEVPLVWDGEAPGDPRARAEFAEDPLASFAEAPGLEPNPRDWIILTPEELE